MHACGVWAGADMGAPASIEHHLSQNKAIVLERCICQYIIDLYWRDTPMSTFHGIPW